MKKFLVTGFKGFIGSNLYSELINLGHNVVGIDDEYLEDNWRLFLLDFLHNGNFDAVFHVGACSDTME